MKKAALHNLGCKVNAYETEAMQQMMEEAGYEIVPFGSKADVYIVNTCSVTNMADRKSRQMLHRAKKLNPDSIVVACGCYVQTSYEQAKEDLSIDIIIGNNRKKDLLRCIREYQEANRVTDACIDINAGVMEYENLKMTRTAEHTRAFVKVQDGCNQFCSYCIIPYARGRVRSRSIADVVDEVTTLSKNGYQEVVLTGIHLSSFGLDHEESLIDLIGAVHQIPGIARIRLGSLEPRVITDTFVSAISKLPKVCPHFHLSLQSGCTSVLKRMNRKYTAEEYANKCEILRKYYEHPAITTDIIVGFPGETEEEFNATMEFVKQVRFYEIHVFKYSKRQGTVAADMKNQVPENVKTNRSNALMEVASQLQEEFINWYQKKTVSVLFEQEVFVDGKRCFEGFTPEYVKVVYETANNLENQIIEVEFS